MKSTVQSRECLEAIIGLSTLLNTQSLLSGVIWHCEQPALGEFLVLLKPGDRSGTIATELGA
jgi:hypothetical protein